MSSEMATFWNCWVRYYRHLDGCVVHVVEDGSDAASKNRAVCGTTVTDYGGLELGTEGFNEPGCKRCATILRNRGILPITSKQ